MKFSVSVFARAGHKWDCNLFQMRANPQVELTQSRLTTVGKVSNSAGDLR